MIWLYMVMAFEGLLMMRLCSIILERGEEDERNE